jgi:hypothetical protein
VPETTPDEGAERAAWFRQDVLARTPSSLKEHVIRLVVEGVRDGLVRLQVDLGVAIAQGEIALPARESYDDAATHLAACGPALDEKGRVDDLQFALTTGEGQHAAFGALGIPLRDIGVQHCFLVLSLIHCSPSSTKR